MTPTRTVVTESRRSDSSTSSHQSSSESDEDMEMAPLTPVKGNAGGGSGDGNKKIKDVDKDDDDIEVTDDNIGGMSGLLIKLRRNGQVLYACSLYCFCSVSMVLVNKSLASSYNHLIDGDLNILLVVIQAVVAVVCVEFCKFMGWVEYPPFNWETAKQWAPVNIFFCAMLHTGMTSLQYNSVPMVTIFKNVTNITTTMGDSYFFGSHVQTLVMVAFGIMLSGAVAAAGNDITISWIGLLWMFMNCIATSGYVLYMKFATKNVKLSTFGMVFYNNVLCVFFLLPVAYIRGEIDLFLSSPRIHTADYAFKNLFAGMVGFILNFASLHCVGVTSPTTYAIIGSLNKIPVAFLGYILFDSVITNETWFFIGVSMMGGFLYSYAKLETSGLRSVQSRK